MSIGSSSHHDQQAKLIALAATVRPELHRYCARLMGSVIDGEDVVQDTLLRALLALQDQREMPPLRPWLFKIAHNRALDLLRGRSLRPADSLDAAERDASFDDDDPVELLMGQEAVTTALSQFAKLPVMQRSVVVLKDVLGEPLADIATLLGVSVDGVKAHLARSRARLRHINAQTAPHPLPSTPSIDVARYVTLFNERNWDALRSLLADDVKLSQSAHSLRVGRAEVGMFFTIYSQSPAVWLAPARLDGQEVIAVFEDRSDTKPSYLMWLEWRNGRITFIRDYRYVRYVIADAQIELTAPIETPGEIVGKGSAGACGPSD